MVQEKLDDWMDEVKLVGNLPEGKGTVAAIHPPVDVETRYGKRKICTIVINGSDGSTINVRMFLPQAFPLVHPKSNLAKILQQHGCTGLRELLGKEVEVIQVGDMIWQIKGQ